MKFNVTDLSDDAVIQNCETLAKLGNGGISGNTVLLAKFTNYTNQSVNKVATAILKVDKNWRWDDSASYGNFSVATTTLTDGNRDIILPRATNTADYSTLWKVYKVRLKDSSGKWYDLIPLASDEDESQDTPTGKPTKYRLFGNSVRFSCIPSSTVITLTQGVQVWFQRAFVNFTSADTTKQLPFISAFHYLIPLDTSASFLLPTDTDLANEYITLFRAGLEDLKSAYATRNDDPQTTKRMKPMKEDNR